METSLADGGVAGEQETGIQVDMDAKDGAAVIRTRPRAAPAKPKSWAEASNEKSKDVKQRIARIERRFSQQLADQEAAHQRQIAELSDKFTKLNTRSDDTASADEAAHTKAMDKFQADLEEAQERGDSKAVAKITREMTQADNRFWSAQTAKKVASGTSESGTRETGDAGKRAAAAAATNGSKHTKAGVAWAKANGEWWMDTTDDTANDARSYANTLHARMLADGDDPEDPDYFERIGKQVAKRFPEIPIKSAVRRGTLLEDDDEAEGDDEGQAPNRRAAAATLPNRGDPARNSRRDLQTLSREDVATMRQVGMDPDKNAHVIQFLKSKQEEAAQNA